MKEYLRVIGVYKDEMFTDIKTETNVDDYIQAAEYMKSYDTGLDERERSNLIWFVEKQVF